MKEWKYTKIVSIFFLLSILLLISGIMILSFYYISLNEINIPLMVTLVLMLFVVIFDCILFYWILYRVSNQALENKEAIDEFKGVEVLQEQPVIKPEEQQCWCNISTLSLLDQVDYMIITFYENGKLLWANNRTCEFFKLNAKKIGDYDLTTLFKHEKCIGEIQYLFNKALKSNYAKKNITISLNEFEEFSFGCTIAKSYDHENRSLYSLICKDISKEMAHANHVHRLVYYDYLTDLPNRDLLLENLEELIRVSELTKNKAAVICIGLDDFKKLNDTFGHTRGDLILKAVAHRLTQLVEHQYELYRIGGDEFAILIKDAARNDEMLRLLPKIAAIFNDPVAVESNNLYVSASIGIAVHGLHGHEAGHIIANANTAMNAIKRTALVKHAYFSQDMKVDIYRNVQVENALRNSIKNNELYLNYQPQINSETGHIRGFEALLRWHNNDLGFVYPNEFIPILESTHQIVSVGYWVLQKACEKQVELFRKTGQQLVICVNISAIQLMQSDFVDCVHEIVATTKILPECLELEITESQIINAISQINVKLEALKILGVKIALDDFGTGYSSLNYLRTLNCDILKIDKTFIDDLNSDTANVNAIVATIITLAKSLNFQIVAEGVEHQEQVDYLRDLGCDYFQGFYFSKPIEEDLLIHMIESHDFINLLSY